METEELMERIIAAAEKNAEEYCSMYRKVARAAFVEGARWAADEALRGTDEIHNAK